MIMYQKKQITEKIKNLIPDHSISGQLYKGLLVDDLLYCWWFGGRTSGSFRLSEKGYQAFKDAGITGYNIELDNKFITIGEYIEFGKKVKCPYFLTHQTITVYDSEAAVLIGLYGGTTSYIKSIK